MRIIAALAVIFHHTCRTVNSHPELFHFTPIQNIVLEIGVSLATWAVPVFFMISGALLLKSGKCITYKMCLTKYIKRPLLALFVFGIPFSCLEIIMTTKKFSFTMIPQGFLKVITGDSWDHLWYLYALVGLYLFLPFIKSFTDHCSRATIRYILTVLFVVNLFLPAVGSSLGISIAFETPIKSSPMFFFLLGKYLDDKVPKHLVQKRRNMIGIAVVLTLKVLAGAYTGANEISFASGRDSILTIILAVFIFVTLKGIQINKINSAFLWNVDRLCFGVYLIHPVFIHFFYKFLKITPLSFGAAWISGVFVFWLIFIVCSFAASWIMCFIRPLKKYVL